MLVGLSNTGSGNYERTNTNYYADNRTFVYLFSRLFLLIVSDSEQKKLDLERSKQYTNKDFNKQNLD